MAKILHILFSLTVGGAARTAIATAKYSAALGPYEPSIAVLSLKNTDPSAVEFALSQGFKVPPIRNRLELLEAIPDFDIIQVNWWQHPTMDEFLRSPLPECRLLGWFHCAGEHPPQRITEELVDVMDMAVAGSFFTHQQPAFTSLPVEERLARTALVNGGTDFDRLRTFTPRQHERFTVSYIGTVDFIKMHPHFISMSARAKLPDARFIVCGGPHVALLRRQAQELEASQAFDIRGYVPDIVPILEETDVFGYPLCLETYAASELALQEAMFCGIPAVVFPHGGLQSLVYDQFNGLVVRSEIEYAQALEYLFHHPDERRRMGDNARHFALQMFGAERWAPKMNQVYERLLALPKRRREYGFSRRSVALAAPTHHERFEGAERFIESCGGQSPQFVQSYCAYDLTQVLRAEEEIKHSTDFMRRAGIGPFHAHYPKDPFLALWSALAEWGAGNPSVACNTFAKIIQAPIGKDSWRLLHYIAEAANQCGETETTAHAQRTLEATTPNYRELLQETRSSFSSQEVPRQNAPRLRA